MRRFTFKILGIVLAPISHQIGSAGHHQRSCSQLGTRRSGQLNTVFSKDAPDQPRTIEPVRPGTSVPIGCMIIPGIGPF